MSLAFESLGWCPQLTLPIDGERSREVWRVLGTSDVHLGSLAWEQQSVQRGPRCDSFSNLNNFPSWAGKSTSTLVTIRVPLNIHRKPTLCHLVATCEPQLQLIVVHCQGIQPG